MPEAEIPSWLSELDQEEEQAVTPTAMDADLPAWLRDETGELVAEPTKIEPTRATDWQPAKKSNQNLSYVINLRPRRLKLNLNRSSLSQRFYRLNLNRHGSSEIQPSQPEAVDVVNIIEERIAAVQETTPPVEPPKQ